MDEGLEPWESFNLLDPSKQVNIQQIADPVLEQVEFQLRLEQLIKNYQTHGHQLASLDPLNLDRKIQDVGFFEPINR